MAYAFRPGLEEARLQLIWDIYNWVGSQDSGDGGITYYGNGPQIVNKNRETPIAWDLAQIFGAIAGGYVIELSPHYKGVQTVRKNKALWARVIPYVKLKVGQACLPYDPDATGERWEQINSIHFFQEGE